MVAVHLVDEVPQEQLLDVIVVLASS